MHHVALYRYQKDRTRFVSTGNQRVLIYSSRPATGRHAFHHSMSQWSFGAEYMLYSLPVWHGNCFDCSQQELYMLLYATHWSEHV